MLNVHFGLNLNGIDEANRDSNGFVRFQAVLYAAIKNAEGITPMLSGPIASRKKLRIKEHKTLLKIQRNIDKANSSGFSFFNKKSKKGSGIVKKANPVVLILFLRMTLYGWKKFSDEFEAERQRVIEEKKLKGAIMLFERRQKEKAITSRKKEMVFKKVHVESETSRPKNNSFKEPIDILLASYRNKKKKNLTEIEVSDHKSSRVFQKKQDKL